MPRGPTFTNPATILGPLLFLIHVNDLQSVTQDTESRIYLYAADAKIYRNTTNVKVDIVKK